MKLSEIIKAFVEEDDEELTDEEIELIDKQEKKIPPDAAKALKGALNLLSKYKAQYPDDIKSAINTLAKFVAYGYPAEKSDEDDDDVKKAGAKLSKDTIAKVKKALEAIMKVPEAIKLLKELIPSDTQKSDELEKKMDKILEELEELKKSSSGSDDDDSGDDDDDDKKKDKKDEYAKRLERIEKMITKLAEAKGLKKSLEGNEGDDDDDDDSGDDDDKDKDVKKKKGRKWSFSLSAPADKE